MPLHQPFLSRRARRTALLAAALAAAALLAAVPTGASAKTGDVKVMTRNVYLGADLTPGVRATGFQELVNAAGGILNSVDKNKFGTRAKGLSAEILAQKPDLVGLQEAALWRTSPCTKTPIPPQATTVRYDYVKLLLAQLNKGKSRYKAVVSQNEFDFEIYSNTDGNTATSAPGCPFGAEINGRLTMRDVILVRRGVKTTRARKGNFDTLLQVKPAGVPVNVTRGWTSVDATVGGSRKFRFVNTHLEAFDNQASNNTNKGTSLGNGQIREAQAKELVASGGPAAKNKLPVILLGDLNSDKKTEVLPGDALAYKVLLAAKFAERSATKPLSCCINADLLTTSGGGKLSDFNHKVDHVMTDTPTRVSLLRSTVTGRKRANGFWDSDHAGLFSLLHLR
jgi:endonuclease/exonuclease/phosphatase family metal-dependent hydrolase